MNSSAKRVVTVAVVDDEPLGRASIEALLRADPSFTVIGTAGSGVEAVQLLRSQRPDVLFLDIEMPGTDGFQILEELGTETPRAIVFVTAHEQYALRAFEARALDYLLKPFSDERFLDTTARLHASLAINPRSEPCLIVKSIGKVEVIRASEIDWVEAADYYACLHVANSRHLVRRTLSDLESDLGTARFCRIHRSAIINMDRVGRIDFNADGDQVVVLRTGTELRLGRRYRERLLRLINDER